jgi:hypothetical protein
MSFEIDEAKLTSLMRALFRIRLLATRITTTDEDGNQALESIADLAAGNCTFLVPCFDQLIKLLSETVSTCARTSDPMKRRSRGATGSSLA